MGVINKLRGELLDVIEWVDDSRHTLVWRFPRYHNQIKYGAQLIVRPGQQAVFVTDGRIADARQTVNVIDAGRAGTGQRDEIHRVRTLQVLTAEL